MLLNLICNICSDIIFLKSLPYLPGVNGLTMARLKHMGFCKIAHDGQPISHPYRWAMQWQRELMLNKVNTLRQRQNGRHSADDPFKRIFVNETLRISMKISLNFVPKGPINNIPALVQIMAWRRRGDKPSSKPMIVVSLLTHICVTRPQWVNTRSPFNYIDQLKSQHG